VVVTTLDFVPHPDLAGEVLHARDEHEEAFLRHIASKVTEDGERRGLKIAFRLVSAHRPPGICTENVTRAFFVSSRGLVSPCVFTNMPVPAGMDEAGLLSPGSLTFGDINNQGLSEIWDRKAYKTFRDDHARGRPGALCGNCRKLFASSNVEWGSK
jgi:MoaA/NifB/PqqE/SkfB family radical SAM enzyme